MSIPSTCNQILENFYLRLLYLYGRSLKFYHPDMKFYFRIPRGWKSENTPQRVTMASQNENGMIIFSANQSNMDLDAYSKKIISEISDSTIVSNAYRSINGMRAYHTLLNVKVKDDGSTSNTAAQMMSVQLSHIRKGNMIYSFMALSPKAQFISFKNDFEFSIHSFRNLCGTQYFSG